MSFAMCRIGVNP